MKLYIVSARDDEGSKHKVCVSQAECGTTRKELNAEGYARKDIETVEVDFPTTKSELVQALNDLLTAPNRDDGVKLLAARIAITS